MSEACTAQPIIIDTDPGYDDAFAILLALAAPELQVLGLTTVAGNVTLDIVSDNARRIVELAGRPNVAVHPGADRPLLRPAAHAFDIHGSMGLNGYDWPPPARPPSAVHALDWMLQTLAASADRTVTLVALGPQTNVAMLLRRAPALAARKLRRIVCMGGNYFAGGNASPAAEFNILVDPEAAAIVFACGIELVAMPLDCTNTALTPVDWISDLASLGTEIGTACAGMMGFLKPPPGQATRPLHDAVAMAWMLWPELFEGRLCNVEIETASPLTLGATVVDWRGRTARPKNCLWINGCNAPEMYARMMERLARLPG